MMKERRPPLYFSEATKRQMIEEVLKGKSKRDVWREYTGRSAEHGKIVEWMRKLGYLKAPLCARVVSLPMPKRESQPSVEELQRKVKELEEKLQESQLKEEAYRR